MIFWIAILVGLIVSYLATRIGFYETLVYAFNLAVSAYLAIFLTPYVVANVPAATEIAMGLPLTLTGLALGVFAVLYGVSYLLFTGQFTIAFPKWIDLPLSAILGFFSGLLIVSLLALILSITPSSWVETLFDSGTSGFHTDALRSCCDRIHRFVKTDDSAVKTEQLIGWLAECKMSKKERPSSAGHDANGFPDGPPTDVDSDVE